MTAYPMIFRFNRPAGLKGLRCRILSNGGRRFWPDGTMQVNSGDNLVLVEFEQGQHVVVYRSAVVAATSPGGRQAVAKVARGGIRMEKVRRLRELGFAP